MGDKLQAWLVCVECGYKVRKKTCGFNPKNCPKCGGKLKEKVVVLK